MGAMFGARSVGDFVQSGKAKEYTHQIFIDVCSQHETTVVCGRQQKMRGYHVSVAAEPDESLELLDFLHFLGRFKKADGPVCHTYARRLKKVWSAERVQLIFFR